jgi:hypothetical protein
MPASAIGCRMAKTDGTGPVKMDVSEKMKNAKGTEAGKAGKQANARTSSEK